MRRYLTLEFTLDGAKNPRSPRVNSVVDTRASRKAHDALPQRNLFSA